MMIENNQLYESMENSIENEKLNLVKAFIFTVTPEGIYLIIPKHNILELPTHKLTIKGPHSLPGGKIQNEEAAEEGLLRELEEEMNLKSDFIINIIEGNKISRKTGKKTFSYSIFFLIAPDFWEPSFEKDPDKEYIGYIKIHLSDTHNLNTFEENLKKTLDLLNLELFFKAEYPNESGQESYINSQNATKHLTSSIQNKLFSILSQQELSIPNVFLKDLQQLQKTLNSIHNFSLKGAKEIVLSDYPIKIILPKDKSENFTIIIDIKSLESLNKIGEILLIISYIFMKAKSKGVLTNQHIIKFEREQRNTLTRGQQNYIIKTIKSFCELQKQKSYINSCVIPKLEKNSNSKRIILTEHGEKPATLDEIEKLNLTPYFFEKPIIFPAHKHYLPIFKGSEEEWKNILKEILNTYYPESESPPKKFEGTFIDFPRLSDLKQRTLAEILNIFFGIYEDKTENFEIISKLFDKALEFYRYSLGGKIPDNFGDKKWFKQSANFSFKNLKDFKEFLNNGTEESKILKWVLLKIAYVINYYLTHIKPKLKDSEKVISDLNSKLISIIGNRAISIRKKLPRSIILKLLRRGQASEVSFKDLVGVQIHLRENDDPQKIVENIISELIDLFPAIPEEGIFEMEIKGNIPNFNYSTFDKSVGIHEITKKENLPFNAITIQFKLNEVPVEIMIFPPHQHRQSEKGLSTHSLYDLIKVLETLTRLFGWLPKNKVKSIIKNYIKQNPETPYQTTLISEIYSQDKSKFQQDLQKRGIKTSNLQNIFLKETRNELLTKDNIGNFLDELSEQLIESFKYNGKIKARKELGKNNELLSFGFSCKDMKNWYGLIQANNAATKGDCYDTKY